MPLSSQVICTQSANSLKQAFKGNEITYGRKSVDTCFLKYQGRVDSITDIRTVHEMPVTLQAKTADKHRTEHTLYAGERMNMFNMLARVLEDPVLVSTVTDNLHDLQKVKHSLSSCKTELPGG